MTARDLIQEAAVYIPLGQESFRISHCEEDGFYCIGEDSGCMYKFTYEEVNLELDSIYKLVLMNQKRSTPGSV